MVISHSKRLGIKHSVLIDDVKLFNGKTEAFDNIKIDNIKNLITELDNSYSVSAEGRT